jgi:hypothetical protein
MTLRLATRDGAPVAGIAPPRRYVSEAGTIRDTAQAGYSPTLAEARLALRGYERMLGEDRPEPERNMLLREAWNLGEAIRQTCEFRRFVGWTNPEDADRPRGVRA